MAPPPAAKLLSILLLLLALQLASAATLRGTIYSEDLTVAKDVLVTIDTQPQQRLLSTDGTYEFMVPPGNYTIRLHYLRGGLNASATENVVVATNGTFTYDLFLIPGLEEEESLYQDISNDFNATPDIPEVPPNPATSGAWPLVILIVVVLALLFVPYHLLKRHFRRLGKEYGDAGEETDGKLQRILALLAKAGGRMTQRELRQQLPESEAKVSLMLAELEAKGKVRKIKKGRGNIIVLKR